MDIAYGFGGAFVDLRHRGAAAPDVGPLCGAAGVGLENEIAPKIVMVECGLGRGDFLCSLPLGVVALGRF